MIPTNQDRADRADRALRYHFNLHTQGATFEDEIPHPLTDLLADLRHWADSEGIDFDVAFDIANRHYSAEKHEERKAGAK
jgi:hypothetical protein